MSMTKNITIDGTKLNTEKNKLFRGQGIISGNNSSRLLLDYKHEHPEVYRELLELVFGSEGLAMSHLKLEMGSDINSSSGTEPSVMRYEDEECDVRRGAGYQLAADAKAINPDLTLDMLWWGEPKWVSDADDVYAARYKWYKETLCAAYKTYGLKFDYVSATQNERGMDAEWIKYLSAHLHSETDCPYDFSAIKIVAGEEVCTWQIADRMLEDEELCNAVDVIGSHYTSWSTDNAKTLGDKYGKEIWFSEASSPMGYSEGISKYDGKGSGLADIGGVLDVANRIIAMYPFGDMTLYEYQPVIAAYYDGVCYCEKQLITAVEPWSGAYSLESGFYMAMHFAKFIKKGWAFAEGACIADGKAGGDGHAIVDSVYSCMTAADIQTGDYSVVITNTTAEPITYSFSVKDLAKAGEKVYIWETRGSDGENFKENYFKKIGEAVPERSGLEHTYSVTLRPYSMITISTLDVEEKEFSQRESALLELPFYDDYEYSESFLAERGNAPRYTTDQGGAFEVMKVGGKNVLMQMITPDLKANEWGYTPEPTTNLGDDRWFNYSVSADVKLSESAEPDKNYAGVGLRYGIAANGASGYWVRLYENGTVQLMRNSDAVETVSLGAESLSEWVKLKITALGNVVKVAVGGTEVISYESSSAALIGAGRAALYSSYNKNCFNNFKAEQAEGEYPYIERYDDMSGIITNIGEWEYTTTGSFKNLHRTLSKAKAGACAKFTFMGTGFAVSGENACESVLSVKIDGSVINDDHMTPQSGARELSYYLYGLESGEHAVEITVKSGEYTIDSIEIIKGMTSYAESKGLEKA